MEELINFFNSMEDSELKISLGNIIPNLDNAIKVYQTDIEQLKSTIETNDTKLSEYKQLIDTQTSELCEYQRTLIGTLTNNKTSSKGKVEGDLDIPPTPVEIIDLSEVIL